MCVVNVSLRRTGAIVMLGSYTSPERPPSSSAALLLRYRAGHARRKNTRVSGACTCSLHIHAPHMCRRTP